MHVPHCANGICANGICANGICANGICAKAIRADSIRPGRCPAVACRLALLAVVVLAPSASLAQVDFVNWESPHVHPLDLTPSGTLLLAVNTPDNRLEVFDVTGPNPLWVRSIPVGLEPVSVRVRTETEAWVINHISDSLSIVDLPSGRVVRTINTGDEPADVVFAGSPQRAFVSISQLNQVRVWNPLNPDLAPTIINIQGEDPRALAVSPDQATVYAAIFESGNRTTIVPQGAVSSPGSPYGGQNPPPNRGLTFDPPRPPGQPAPPPVSQIVRQNAAARWIDDNNRDWTNFVNWGLHDNDVAIINTATLGVSYARGLMTTVMALGVRPDGVVTAVGTEALNEIRFEPNLNGIFLRVRLGWFDPAAAQTVNTADLNPHLDYVSRTLPPAQRALSLGDPRGVTWNAAGDRGFVAGMGSNNVIVIDSQGGRVATIPVGAGPTGLALSPEGTRLYVLNRFDASVSVLDTAAQLELTRTGFYDPTPDELRLGRPLLYDTHRTSGLGHVSCAGCHIDARWDGLAWDLGNPAGTVRPVDEPCRQGPGRCAPWHPLKGPMVTQTLVGNRDTEALHWRGDRPDIAAFRVTYQSVQSAPAAPSDDEMEQLTAFIHSLRFPPNPNRNLDGGLPTVLPVPGGTGNAATGLTIFQTQPTLGALTCVGCHALPAGTDHTIDFPPGAPPQQSFDIAHLQNMYEKIGFLRASQNNNRGFGFNHDSDRDTLQAVLGPPFQWPPGPPGVQMRRDVEAFLLCFSTDTHAAVGQQITFDGLNNNNPQLINRLNLFSALASGGQVGLIAKGRLDGLERGFVHIPGGLMARDRSAEAPLTVSALRAAATAGGEVTFTVVPYGTQMRLGVDRDADGYRDRDELDAGSDPADPLSIPQPLLLGDLNCDGIVSFDDIEPFVLALTSASGYAQAYPACERLRADVTRDGLVDFDDIAGFVTCLALGACP